MLRDDIHHLGEREADLARGAAPLGAWLRPLARAVERLRGPCLPGPP